MSSDGQTQRTEADKGQVRIHTTIPNPICEADLDAEEL